jgi:DNA-directed RNA polymerase subunit RPC12/RpoP
MIDAHDIKFCPLCGSQRLYLTTDPDQHRCHGCGEDFALLDPEHLEDLEQIEEDHKACPACDWIDAMEKLEEALRNYRDTLLELTSETIDVDDVLQDVQKILDLAKEV